MGPYRNIGRWKVLSLTTVFAFVLINSCFSANASDPHSAYYSAANDRLFWFIQISDIHIGANGTQDQEYLTWIVNEGKSVIQPEFIVASGDLTDSTDGNFFGVPNGPYQDEWDQYKAILANKVDANNFYDIPGNHDAYNDKYFSYYLANSVQGQATGKTQMSWTRTFSFGTYHFLGVNSADSSGDSFSLFWPYGDYAGLDESELKFISNELYSYRDASLTLVFGHHPVTSTGDSQDTYLYYGAPEFIAELDSYVASLYGYGHTHRSEKRLFLGDGHTGYMGHGGVYYLNVPSLGKSEDLHYSVMAIDCNAVSSVTQAKGSWPVVLVTAPVSKFIGSSPNPYAYSVPNANANPIRALVFDVNGISSVQFRINGTGDWHPMAQARANVWEGVWDASAIQPGDCTIEVQAASSSGIKSNTVIVSVESTSGCGNGSCDQGEDSCNCPGDCGGPPNEICTDGIDNDCDGSIDCADSDCQYDPACSPNCGNGVCDEGENCDICSADCIGGGGGNICGNGVCEPTNNENCISCPADCAGVQGGKPAGRFCCGDGGGVNPIGCDDSRCNTEVYICGGTSPSPYCCGDGLCEGLEDECNCPADCGSPGPEICDDGIDNDCNGYTDCADPRCQAAPYCLSGCGAKKATCSTNSDCCSNRCSSKGICL